MCLEYVKAQPREYTKTSGVSVNMTRSSLENTNGYSNSSLKVDKVIMTGHKMDAYIYSGGMV